MTDLLRVGSRFLEDQRHLHMTRPVSYRRGLDSIDLVATVGRTLFEQTDQFGALHRSESRDYLIRASDLVLAGGPATPKPGDVVREDLGTEVLLYEAVALGGEPPFRFSDPDRLTLRLHTKFIGMEAAP